MFSLLPTCWFHTIVLLILQGVLALCMRYSVLTDFIKGVAMGYTCPSNSPFCHSCSSFSHTTTTQCCSVCCCVITIIMYTAPLNKLTALLSPVTRLRKTCKTVSRVHCLSSYIMQELTISISSMINPWTDVHLLPLLQLRPLRRLDNSRKACQNKITYEGKKITMLIDLSMEIDNTTFEAASRWPMSSVPPMRNKQYKHRLLEWVLFY